MMSLWHHRSTNLKSNLFIYCSFSEKHFYRRHLPTTSFWLVIWEKDHNRFLPPWSRGTSAQKINSIQQPWNCNWNNLLPLNNWTVLFPRAHVWLTNYTLYFSDIFRRPPLDVLFSEKKMSITLYSSFIIFSGLI